MVPCHEYRGGEVRQRLFNARGDEKTCRVRSPKEQVRTSANTCHHPNTTGNQRAAHTTARYLCNAAAMKMIIPANSEAKALLILPGTSEAVDANVIAWEFDEHRPSPPRPIVAPDLPGARVAVCINAVQLFEWPGTVHANREAFLA